MEPDDRLLRIADMRQCFGNCSDMWIERRLKDDPNFPRPIYIRKRRFWSNNGVLAYKRLKGAVA
jgi:predicted DNA-binding transcriptional regulator AlpA